MGGPVWAIRLINQKQLLLVMVGVNIILSVGKNKNIVYILKSSISWKVSSEARAGVSEFLTFENI
jgi:hypothetical protein